MTINFNDNWLFSANGGESTAVNLPHDAMLCGRRSAGSAGGVNSGYFEGGRYSYEKRFTLDPSLPRGYAALHFEGVYQNCIVFCNGIEVGKHRYGYTPFDVDITSVLREGENIIRVDVDNSLMPNCRWYSGAGIYRPVSLILKEKNEIKSVHISTASISPPTVSVEVDAENTARVEIFDGDALIWSGSAGEAVLPDAELWSEESPRLYTCLVSTEHDSEKVRFGIRELRWSAEQGLTVNGERVLLRGGCIHHDHGVLGACEFRAAEERRLRILKENGFNALRISHNPASRITLDLCDELGLYVMNEAFDGWYTPKTYHDYSRIFEADWPSDIQAMVESSRNHPSVIMYSIGNEVSETAEERGGELCREMVKFTHSLDPSRPVTAGINVLINVYAQMGIGIYRDSGNYQPLPLENIKGYKDRKSGSAFFNSVTSKLGKLMFFMASGKKGDRACLGASSLDVLGLNYASSQYDYQAKKHPSRMMVGSETMVADVPYNFERVRKYPALLGDFVWSAWDYLGEACIGDWTYHSYPGLPLLAGQGMIDITGKPLAAMAYLQIAWGIRRQPYLCVRPLNHVGETPTKGSWQFTNAIDSWSWDGYEGKRATVEVYSDAYSATLYLNGRKIGTKRLKNNKALFKTAYAPGCLYAVVYDREGNKLGRAELRSGGADTLLTATPEKRTISSGAQDLCYIPIEFTDKEGRLKPYIEKEVEVKVEGAATLLGFGSALCKTDESYTDNKHRSYRGRCLAVLRSAQSGGTARVTVSAEGFEPVELEIEVT